MNATLTEIRTPNGQGWVEVTERQENLIAQGQGKGRYLARVAREMPANFTGEFPTWCDKYLVVLTTTLEGKPDRDFFWEVDGIDAGLKMIADQFSKMKTPTVN